MRLPTEAISRYCALALVAANVCVWYAVWYVDAHRNLALSFFDVGQGDAIFITAPNGNQILVDGGPSDRIVARIGRELPFWDRSIEVVLVTHPHADHLAGALEVLRRYDVGVIIESGARHSIAEYDEWRGLVEARRIPVVTAAAGTRIRFAAGGELEILAPFEDFSGASPDNQHDAAVVARLAYGSASAMLTGDAERAVEYRVLFSGADVRADILKVGHHGSRTSTSEQFLAAVAPRFAVIQAGARNRYGHPHQEVLDRLASFGAAVFRTDRDGDIVFRSDGRQWFDGSGRIMERIANAP